MDNPVQGPLKDLNPEELEIVKGQVAVLLNYTRQGGSVASLPEAILQKISPAGRQAIVNNVASVLGVQGS